MTTVSPPDPFYLTLQNYARWRDTKLARYPLCQDAWMVMLHDLAHPSSAELRRLRTVMAHTRFVGYHTDKPVTQAVLKRFAATLGLHQLDENLCADEEGLSAITVRDTGRGNDYIPYTNKPLSWHTDGYYNPPGQQVGAWLLHCMQPAAKGGDNGLCDHELAYIALREQDPAQVEALSQPDALTIPANWEGSTLIRPAQQGPVFSVDAHGQLHMRYSARKRHIQWRDDPDTQRAAASLLHWLDTQSPYQVYYRLNAGEGILSNNVLHNRSGFTDNPATPRLLYRARYHDRIRSSGEPHALFE